VKRRAIGDRTCPAGASPAADRVAAAPDAGGGIEPESPLEQP